MVSYINLRSGQTNIQCILQPKLVIYYYCKIYVKNELNSIYYTIIIPGFSTCLKKFIEIIKRRHRLK